MYARQMRLLVSLSLVLFVSCLNAETVYKTVDEDGRTIFTDKASEEAEEINIQKLETIENPNPAKYTPRPKQAEESTFKYENFVVNSPENGAGIRSNNGNVSISLTLEPTLHAGHKIIISMDGKEVGSGTSASLQNVDRGTHSISASVVDGSGKQLMSTSSTFSLLRATK